jgi:hypothetical protein
MIAAQPVRALDQQQVHVRAPLGDGKRGETAGKTAAGNDQPVGGNGVGQEMRPS